MSERDNIIVGITGASGAVYARAMVCELLGQGLLVHLIPTENAPAIWRTEVESAPGDEAVGRGGAGLSSEPDWADRLGLSDEQRRRLTVYRNGDIAAPPASGTFAARAMIVVPCSMNTLAKIARGLSDTLLTRAAAVCLKERRPLVLVPRESPLSLIDLRNMVAAAEAGAVILPAMPGFYHRPRSIEDLVAFVVSKICDQIGVRCSKPTRYEGSPDR